MRDPQTISVLAQPVTLSPVQSKLGWYRLDGWPTAYITSPDSQETSVLRFYLRGSKHWTFSLWSSTWAKKKRSVFNALSKPPHFRGSMRKTVSGLYFGFMQLSRVLVVTTGHVVRLPNKTIVSAWNVVEAVYNIWPPNATPTSASAPYHIYTYIYIQQSRLPKAQKIC